MKMHHRSAPCGLSLGLAALLISACGGFGPAARRAGPPGHTASGNQGYAAPDHASSGAPGEASGDDGGYDVDYGGGAPASASRGGSLASQGSDGARVETPKQRPGLGTVFGETITSSVTTRPFARASQSPFAAIAMHYNDAEGVNAHARYLGTSPQPLAIHTPGGGIAIALTDVYGNQLAGVTAGGKTFIVGSEGERYNLVLTNETGGRFEVVASVDGLDVIDGRPADVAKRGYILEPYASLVIDGFRRSESSVAAFRFGRVESSYAARTSGDRNVGVVGVAFFSERGSRWSSDELQRRDTADPFPGDRDYARPPSY